MVNNMLSWTGYWISKGAHQHGYDSLLDSREGDFAEAYCKPIINTASSESTAFNTASDRSLLSLDHNLQDEETTGLNDKYEYTDTVSWSSLQPMVFQSTYTYGCFTMPAHFTTWRIEVHNYSISSRLAYSVSFVLVIARLSHVKIIHNHYKIHWSFNFLLEEIRTMLHSFVCYYYVN